MIWDLFITGPATSRSSTENRFAAVRVQMRKKTQAGPCTTLSAEERAVIERQLQAQGRLRAANQDELEKLRVARRMKGINHSIAIAR